MPTYQADLTEVENMEMKVDGCNQILTPEEIDYILKALEAELKKDNYANLK